MNTDNLKQHEDTPPPTPLRGINKQWNDMYKQLELYKQKYGDCLVPKGYKEDAKLGRWVDHQRKCYKEDKLSEYRLIKLKEIGFVFSSVERTSWNDMYHRLVSYKEIYGNCLVPKGYKEDTKLGRWVTAQRTSKRQKLLSKERTERLLSIGFEFIVKKNTPWNDMFNRLVLYKQRYGNCLVPQTYDEDKSLGNWVSHQRTFYKNNKLSNYRIDQLNSIKFAFKINNSKLHGSPDSNNNNNENDPKTTTTMVSDDTDSSASSIITSAAAATTTSTTETVPKIKRHDGSSMTNQPSSKMSAAAAATATTVVNNNDNYNKIKYLSEVASILRSANTTTSNIGMNSNSNSKTKESIQDFAVPTNTSSTFTSTATTTTTRQTTNTKFVTSCNDNDSIFCDAEEDIDLNCGLT